MLRRGYSDENAWFIVHVGQPELVQRAPEAGRHHNTRAIESIGPRFRPSPDSITGADFEGDTPHEHCVVRARPRRLNPDLLQREQANSTHTSEQGSIYQSIIAIEFTILLIEQFLRVHT